MTQKISFASSYVFFIGDLNFRLMENLSMKDIDDLLKNKLLSKLLEKDQLRITMKKHVAFTEFTEATIEFPPTYKYEFSSQQFDSK